MTQTIQEFEPVLRESATFDRFNDSGNSTCQLTVAAIFAEVAQT